MIAFCVVVFVVIVVFETQSELGRQARQPTAPTDAAASSQADMAKAGLEPVSLQKRLSEYYRSHDLPTGWVVAGISAPGEDAGTVRLVFSPSPQDRRYGQPAPAKDVANGSFCPKPATFWAEANGAAISAELSDKTGVIKTIACTAPSETH